MANSHDLVPMSEVVDQLTLVDLCRICGSSAEWVVELVEEGILEPEGQGKPAWRFESTSITVVRKVQRLQVDLRLNVPGIAAVLSLVDENAALRRRLQVLEAVGQYAIPMSGPDE
ncbi:chaperone modulator CbpM [Roseovarius sp. S4756]|uniref:chaperone modulator CbpM n=1 Tax=Roseovarius maritimus TaxID=3342637 RepID=UPI003727F644